MHYKRRIFGLLLSLVFVLLSVGCNSSSPSSDQPQIDDVSNVKAFAVHYLDVGQGDSIFIKFNDDKNMLIDTGDRDGLGRNYQFIEQYLINNGVANIDYLVLTHPDMDHIGNAKKIIEKFGVSEAFLPYIAQDLMGDYPDYKEVYDLLINESVKITYSDCYQKIKGEDYSLAFLSPMPKGFSNSSYDAFNAVLVADADLINNLSPIMYLEVQGSRFLFTGDAGKSQEQLVVDNYKAGLYQTIFAKHYIDVKLEEIDCLKIGHHGGDDSSGNEFLQLLTPKTAIISVGGNNYYGHPKSEVLERLFLANETCSLYRTDYHGTITVCLNQNKFEIKTDIDD